MLTISGAKKVAQPPISPYIKFAVETRKFIGIATNVALSKSVKLDCAGFRLIARSRDRERL